MTTRAGIGLAAILVVTACSSSPAATSGPALDSVSPTTVTPSSTVPTTTESTAPPQPVELTTTTEPARPPIVIGIAGDTTFTNGLDQQEPLVQVADLLSSYDVMVVNLETAVADPDVGRPPVAKRFLFKSPPSSLDLLVAAGVDAVTLGNNHALDYGPEGIAQTLDELDARGLLRVGGGRDEAEAYTPLLVEAGGWTIALHSFSRVPCDWSASGENVRPEVAWACPPFLERADAAIRSTLAQADVTIVNVHGGEEGVLCPSGFMAELHEHWAGLGVDAVVGGHPHVVQGVNRIDDTWIAHSTGNFAFPPARGITANSVIIELAISEPSDSPGSGHDGPTVQMGVTPLRADGGVLRPPTTDQAAAIVQQINEHSTGWVVGDEGDVVAAPDHLGRC